MEISTFATSENVQVATANEALRAPACIPFFLSPVDLLLQTSEMRGEGGVLTGQRMAGAQGPPQTATPNPTTWNPLGEKFRNVFISVNLTSGCQAMPWAIKTLT